MSEPKLYRVRVEADVYVVAASAAEAEGYALREPDVVDDAMENALVHASVVTVKGLSWDEECSFPWVDDDLEEEDRELTVGEWARLNDEAADRARREREFNAKQLKLPGT